MCEALEACLNIAAAAEHVLEVEQYIRTIRERVHSIYNSLTFKKMPTRLIAEMIYTSVYWLNSFSSESHISSTLSQKALVTGLKQDYHNSCKLEFGTYIQTHEAHNNSMLRQLELQLCAPLVTHKVGITSIALALVGEYISAAGLNSQCLLKQRNVWRNLLRMEMD